MFSALLAALLPILHPVNAIVTDIEGTTTAVSFVFDTLFPYAKQHVTEYVAEHKNEPAVQKILAEVQAIAGVSSEKVVPTLLEWMAQDKKITPLKALQGLMWEDGYRKGEFKGHIYDDAYVQMKKWKNEGLALYVYSSGSVHAQKLLFGFSTHGDTTPLFSNYFDTNVGGKRVSSSYTAIATQIGVSPEKILFLSDTVEELNAAKEAGMQTVLLDREGTIANRNGHPTVATFDEVALP